MTETAWVVMRSDGEYDTRVTWPVAVFACEEDADRFVATSEADLAASLAEDAALKLRFPDPTIQIVTHYFADGRPPVQEGRAELSLARDAVNAQRARAKLCHVDGRDDSEWEVVAVSFWPSNEEKPAAPI